MEQGFELDLTTDEGRQKAKEFVYNVVNQDNKEIIGKLLFLLLDAVARDQIEINWLKGRFMDLSSKKLDISIYERDQKPNKI